MMATLGTMLEYVNTIILVAFTAGKREGGLERICAAQNPAVRHF